MTSNEDTVALILTARIGSSRLPGKTMMPFAEGTVLSVCVDRLRRSRWGGSLIVATPDTPENDPIARLAGDIGVHVHRGDEQDVLGRVVDAARWAEADIVVRLTADCPLNDAAVVDRCVEPVLSGEVDFATTKYRYPMGIDSEVMRRDVLESLSARCLGADEREHVTLGLWRRSIDCRARTIEAPIGLKRPDIVLTLDDADDYARLRRLAEGFANRIVDVPAEALIAAVERDERLLRTRDVPRGFNDD